MKFMWAAVDWIPLWECPSGKETKMCHICHVIYCPHSVFPFQNMENKLSTYRVRPQDGPQEMERN